MNPMDPGVAPRAPGTESDREMGSGLLWMCRTALVLLGAVALLGGLALPALFAAAWILAFAATFSPYRTETMGAVSTVAATVVFFVLW